MCQNRTADASANGMEGFSLLIGCKCRSEEGTGCEAGFEYHVAG